MNNDVAEKSEEVCNLMNLAFNIGESSPLDNGSDELESNREDRFVDSPSQIETSEIDRSTTLSPSEKLDLKAELESLLMSLQLAIPQPPISALTFESSLISGLPSPETIAHTQQLLHALNTTHDRISSVYANLQVTHQSNQAQVDAIDGSILEVKQLKFRIQQLARHSKNQLEQAAKMLGSIEQIHTEIATGLTKFGGYSEIQSMLLQLETTRHDLIIAHERATTGQAAFYDSLKAIQVDAAARSDESEHKLNRYHESIQSLSQTISSDRLQIATMSVDLSTELTDLHSLNTQITSTHTQIIAASEAMRSRIVEIDREFVALSVSVQTEKEQFYELTVAAIEKTDQIGSQLANIIKQIGDDRDSISTLKSQLEGVRHLARQEIEQKLNNLDLRYHQLISTWDDFQVRQKDRAINTRKFSSWLWILSVAVGGILVLLIRILMLLR
jgi:chromosome segregation ATPase